MGNLSGDSKNEANKVEENKKKMDAWPDAFFTYHKHQVAFLSE